MLDVFARMPQGDASYGFRLILGPRDAAAGDAPAIANVRFEPALPVEELRRMAEEHGVEGGMIQSHYRVGGEVHTWGWAGGFGADFEKERLAPFADITSGDGQMATGEKNTSPETSAVRGAVQEEEAGPKEISGIEFYGPASVLETLIREEEARFSQSNVTTEAALREMLRNMPEGCCN